MFFGDNLVSMLLCFIIVIFEVLLGYSLFMYIMVLLGVILVIDFIVCLFL